MKNAANFLALLSLLLYPTGYSICEFFYEDDIVQWRLLRDTLKGVEVISLAMLAILPKTRISKASMYALILLCIGNLVDRLLFDLSVFIWTDYILLLYAAVVFIIKYKGHDKGDPERTRG